MAHTVPLLLVASLLTGTAVFGLETAITPRLMEEALALGQSRIESVHTRYHQPYRLQVGRAPFDYIDVITPFRRVVLITEERSRLGIRGFTQREAAEALGDRAGVVELLVEMTFHPQNTFVGVPGYDVELVAAASPTARLMPREVTRHPRFGARIDIGPLAAPPGALPNSPGGAMPVTGGTIVATFPVGTLGAAGVYDVVIREMGKELVRARVNVAGLR